MNNLYHLLAQSFMRIACSAFVPIRIGTKAGCPTLAAVLWFGALSVKAATFYVATNGTSTDFLTWATAATNIQDAVNGATNDDIVLVSNGVYTTTTPVVLGASWETNIVALTNRITLKSVNGPLVTVIDGNYPAKAARGVLVSQQAILDGFTVRNANVGAGVNGGGIYIAFRGTNDAHNSSWGGIVTNCIVYGNYAKTGGGIFMQSATCIVANCTIYSNTAVLTGGGVDNHYTLSGTMVNNCVIWRNKALGADGGGGLFIYSAYSTVKNCLFYQNNSYGNGGGIVIYSWHAKVLENCTLTANTATNMGGGFYMMDASAQPVRNLIIWNNYAGGNYADAFTTNLNVLTNSCIGNTNGVPNWNTSGNITNNPQFINTANNNYRLLASSPCINAGTNQAWMTNGMDLDGKPRIRYGWVDIGAYEHINRGTIYCF